MKTIKMAMVAAMLLAVLNCTASMAVSPEMQSCMGSHGSREQYLPVITKYADEDIVQKAMGLLAIPRPYVVFTTRQGGQTIYTVEGVVAEGTAGYPNGSVVTYRVAWQGNRIVSLEFVSVRNLTDAIPSFTT
jgi:hypothetical protein